MQTGPSMGTFEELMAQDQGFLEWAESAGGRAAMASQLRTLKARAAATVVSQVRGCVRQVGRYGCEFGCVRVNKHMLCTLKLTAVPTGTFVPVCACAAFMLRSELLWRRFKVTDIGCVQV